MADFYKRQFALYKTLDYIAINADIDQIAPAAAVSSGSSLFVHWNSAFKSVTECIGGTKPFAEYHYVPLTAVFAVSRRTVVRRREFRLIK